MTEHLEPEKELDHQPTLQDSFTSLFEAGPQFKDNLEHDIEAENIHQIFQQVQQLDNQIFSLNLQIDSDNKIIDQEKKRSQKKVFLLSFTILFVTYLVGIRYFSHDWIDALGYSLLGLIPGLTLFTILSEGVSWICRKTHFAKWRKKQGGDEILQRYENLKELLTQTYQHRDVFYKNNFTERLYFQSLYAYDEMIERIQKTYPESFLETLSGKNLYEPQGHREVLKKIYQSGLPGVFLHKFFELMNHEHTIAQQWRQSSSFHDTRLEQKYEDYAEKRKNDLNRII